MRKSIITLVALMIILSSCHNNVQKRVDSKEIMKIEMSKEFDAIIANIEKSNVYERPEKWEERGLNQSEKSVVYLLRQTTNKFLFDLRKIHTSKESDEIKLKQINKIVDNIPWSSLDTEEKEFLADVLAPAIQATGFNPWSIF